MVFISTSHEPTAASTHTCDKCHQPFTMPADSGSFLMVGEITIALCSKCHPVARVTLGSTGDFEPMVVKRS